MNPIIKPAIALLAAALLSAPAFAQESNGIGIYVAPHISYGQVKTSYDTQERSGFTFDENLSHSKWAAGWGLAVGYDFNTKFFVPIRLELQYLDMGETKKTHHDSGSGYDEDMRSNVDVSAALFNIYYDFRNHSSFTPYGGIGLGWSSLSVKGAWDNNMYPAYSEKYGKKTARNLAWGVSTGCAWQATKWFALDLGYRYTNFGEAKTKYYEYTGTPVSDDYRLKFKKVETHQILLSGRFTF